MLLSIVIPVYNCSLYLKDCVRQLETLSCDYEIILVDDGSPDESPELCDELVSYSSNVRCIHQANQGVSVARNVGIEQAQGDYIYCLDADDTLDIDLFNQVLIHLQDNPLIDMLIFGMTFDYYHKGKCYRRDQMLPSLNGTRQKEEWQLHLIELFKDNAISPVWNKIIKKSLIVDYKLFFNSDMFLYEDLEFSLRVMAHCDMIDFCQEAIYHYRQSEDEGNAGRRLKRIPDLSKLVVQIENALNQCDNSQDVKEGILLPLYATIVREKVAVSSLKGIKEICHDFSKWYQSHQLTSTNKDVDRLLHHKVMNLILRRTYSRLRHSLAVKVKSSHLYQKMKG